VLEKHKKLRSKVSVSEWQKMEIILAKFTRSEGKKD